MKTLLIGLLLLPLSATMVAQDMSGITKALAKGDAQALSAHLAADVELSLDGEDDILAKAEAVKKLQAFFASRKVSAFNEKHQGASKGNGSHYAIGDMVAGGKSYGVFLLLNIVGNKYQIAELRIE